MNVTAQFFDSDGESRKIKLNEFDFSVVTDRQLLWVNILERDESLIGEVATLLQLKKVPVKKIAKIQGRPEISKYPQFYHFFVISVAIGEDEKVCPIPIDFLVGKNFIITVHDGDVPYLQQLARRDESQTALGVLDAESFIVTMLDLHIASYFLVLEKIEKEVDEMDAEILEKDLDDESFLKRMVELRGAVSRLRRWFLPHRDVFYTLSRPDFREAADTDSFESFQLLDDHFESAVDSIESSRETVLSLFDLYTTKTSHRMNNVIKRLTFITLMVGMMSVIAGVLGMNFEEEFFKTSNAFWYAIAAMLTLAVGTTLFAWKKKWY